MMTDIQAAAVAQVRNSFTTRMARLITEIAAQEHGQYIFAWEQYSLGVKLDAEGKPRTVGVEDATVFTHRGTGQRYSNGSGQPAVFLDRAVALRRALANVQASHDHLEAVLLKQGVG